MKHSNYLLAFIATFTMLAEAKDIYETKGKEGSVEFTDQPSSNAKVIEIQAPNIADGVDIPEPTQNKPEIKPTEPDQPSKPEVIYRGIADDDHINPKRARLEERIEERRDEHQEPRERQKKATAHPAAKGR